jgi:ribosomal protein S18 acetylase RimI-like enzyme
MIDIRTATESDVAAIAQLHLASWLATYRGICADAFLNSLTVELFASYHRPALTKSPDEMARSPFIVACDRAEAHAIVGFARGGPMRVASPTGDAIPAEIAQQFSAELYAIYVHPASLGRGAGRALWDESISRLQAIDHRNLCVWVLRDNAPARRFYERMGGVLVGESSITLAGVSYPEVAYGWHDITSR